MTFHGGVVGATLQIITSKIPGKERAMELVATTRSRSRLRVSAVGISLTAFFVFSFILCVLGALLFPGMIVHRMLEFRLPSC